MPSAGRSLPLEQQETHFFRERLCSSSPDHSTPAGNGGRGNTSGGSGSQGLIRLIPEKKYRAVKWPPESLRLPTGSARPLTPCQDLSPLPTSPPISSGRGEPCTAGSVRGFRTNSSKLVSPTAKGVPQTHLNATGMPEAVSYLQSCRSADPLRDETGPFCLCAHSSCGD